MRKTNFVLIGFLMSLIGISIYVSGVLIAPFRWLFNTELLLQINHAIVWYSGIFVFIGFVLILVDLFVFFPKKRKNTHIMYEPIENKRLTVVLTAYNDELSIAQAVRDFKHHPLVERVIVISNNSTDSTLQEANEAIAYNEHLQGYGYCVYRALNEGVKYDDTALTLLCEGDMTFRARDIEKFIAYIPHAEFVVGTRIVEQLRDKRTQLSTFMFYGNFFVGKLLEMKHLGKGTFTDVGTTYKLCRNSALKKLLPRLDPKINLEFNAYFLDKALENEIRVVECPITFHKRVGDSKGGNVNNRTALKVGLRMIKGIVFWWHESDNVKSTR